MEPVGRFLRRGGRTGDAPAPTRIIAGPEWVAAAAAGSSNERSKGAQTSRADLTPTCYVEPIERARAAEKQLAREWRERMRMRIVMASALAEPSKDV